MNQHNDMETQLEQARKKNLAEIQKTKQCRADFEKLKTQYNSQVDDLRRKIHAENKSRELNQAQAIKNE